MTNPSDSLPVTRRSRARRAVDWVRGRDLPPERYVLCRRLFCGWLALVYLCAFASLWVQIDGLVGSGGILPSAAWLARVRDALGDEAFRRVPSLLWLSASDAALHAHCAAGVVISLAVLAGVWPRLGFALLWTLYLSLAGGIDTFLNYQWDALLLEAGLLAVLFAPRSRSGLAEWNAPVSRTALWLLRWLLFRLMFVSGWVKLASGDAAWRSLRALDYHYFTQPLPSWTSYYAHHLPDGVHTASVAATFGIELAAPLLIFGPRRGRRVAFMAFMLLQLSIAATGSYGFFNLLTIGLCLPLLDDAAVARGIPSKLRARLASANDGDAVSPAHALRKATIALLASLIVVVSLAQLDTRLGPQPPSRFSQAIVTAAAPLRSINGYGLFAVMTTERPEITVEGSRDGESWQAYRFRWKPGALDERPRFAFFHMPRLDWQMWFAALGSCQRSPWFQRFSLRLLEGAPEVDALMAQNPFENAPPTYLRTTVHLYEFVPPHSSSGAWWRSVRRGPYCPTLALDAGRLRAVDLR